MLSMQYTTIVAVWSIQINGNHQLNWSSCLNNSHRIIHLFQYVLCLYFIVTKMDWTSEEVEHPSYVAFEALQ